MGFFEAENFKNGENDVLLQPVIRKVTEKMKPMLLLSLLLLAHLCMQAHEKEIYIPHDLQDMDLMGDSEGWSLKRTVKSENFVVFWEKGFGSDPSNAPKLEGHSMNVDLKNLLERLESYYAFYRDTLQFVRPGSKSEKYRMMVMISYSLEGTAYGGDYDGVIGALWVAPNRIQDRKLNCIAHELGHCFQSQIRCDGQGGEGHLGGFHEMTSQWMLWQVNPEWMTDENYHWQEFIRSTHLPLFDRRNIYHSPYVLEYWGWKHGRWVLAELYRQVRKGEDPAETYKRVLGLTQQQLNDEMFDCYCRLVTYDMPRIHSAASPYAGKWEVTDQRLGNYGFNIHDLTLKLKTMGKGERLSVTLQGQTPESQEAAEWSWGFVAVKDDGTPVYGAQKRGKKGTIRFRPEGKERFRQLFLVVVATPSVYLKRGEPYPYSLSIKNS